MKRANVDAEMGSKAMEEQMVLFEKNKLSDLKVKVNLNCIWFRKVKVNLNCFWFRKRFNLMILFEI